MEICVPSCNSAGVIHFKFLSAFNLVSTNRDIYFIKTMVKKRVKRKAAATSSSNATGFGDSIEKNYSQVYNEEVVTPMTPDQGMSHNDLNKFLNVHPIHTDNSANEKVTMTKKSGITMLGSTNATRRTKDVSSTSTNGARPKSLHDQNDQTKSTIDDIDYLTLWQYPMTTLDYFIRELFIDCLSFAKKTLRYKKSVFCLVSLTTLFFVLGRLSGPQQEIFMSWEVQVRWWLYWMGLGVLSSVGLGTGLHTFVLYLGPHIAAVTMAAYECGALNFPEPPYPDQIICPTTIDTTWTVGILNIMRKVRVEAMMWGAGTALGELPPYFMARAARTSCKDQEFNQEEEELKELEALEALESGQDIPLMMQLKLYMKYFVENAGFLGILACASIPNPLFDFAGITCGHYLVPFWKFFGATLIGKAIVKMHIQQLVVIVAFNEELLDKAISFLAYVPVVGTKFQAPLKKYLVEQKRKLHDKSLAESATTISWLFDKFIIFMVCYFLVTIIHALARNHYRRRTKSSAD